MPGQPPRMQGWFYLQDGRYLNLEHVVWYRTKTQPKMIDRELAIPDPYTEVMLVTGELLELADDKDYANFDHITRPKIPE